MGKRSREKAEKRDREKAAARAAIASQYGLPKSAMETSKPRSLGRAMFLNRREMKKYETSGGKFPEYLPLPGSVK